MKINQRDRDFTQYLDELRKGHQGRAAMAVLRRALGKAPGEAPEADRYILRWLPSQPSAWQLRQEKAYYLVASLFAVHQMPSPSADGGQPGRNFGASMRELADAVPSGGPERRFIATLTCALEELPDHLRHAVSLLKSKSIAIDWPQLLADIPHWEDEGRRVQSEWARAFWGAGPPEIATRGQRKEHVETGDQE